VINHSQQPRKPTGRSLFSQICTRIMIHETAGILPCRGVAERGSYIVYHLSPRDIAFSEGLNGFPRRSRWWAYQSAPYSRESADNAVGVSAPVALRLLPSHLAQLWLSSCAFDRACELWQSRCFAPAGPPGNSGRVHSSATHPGQAFRHSGGRPWAPEHRAFFLAAELKKRPTRRVWALVQLRP
jgi:hypothetical protein